jgi:type VI secretion system protein ImpC
MAKEAQKKTADAVVETREADDFSSVLKQSFKPRSERAATEVENAVTTLVEQALADTSVVKEDVLDTI